MYQPLVKHIVYPLHEAAFGRKTFAFLREMEAQQWLSPEQLEDLKFEKLKALLTHAEANVPFYAKRFSDAGFSPAKMQAASDLAAVPALGKAEIKANLEGMRWKDAPGGLFRYNTGGSSGEPLIFYFDRRRQAADKAARMMTHRWFDVDVGHRELYLWGSPVELTKQDRLKILRDQLTNELLLSAFELSEAKVPEMFKQMQAFGPRCLFGYPSSIALFCEMAQAQGLNLPSLGVKVVFATAEKLYDHQREAISQALGNIPVVDSYGSREGGFVSHECEHGRHHTMDMSFHLELLSGDAPSAPGEDGEIVLTHLDAWGMPFIRYRTGDVARQGQGQCACGRGLATLSAIQGRTTDFIVTPDGRWQHALSLIYIVRDIPGVDEFKILQDAPDKVTVLLKTISDLYPDGGDAMVEKGFHDRMGQDVAVTVEHVESVPREASGKYRYVVSKVAAGGFGQASNQASGQTSEEGRA
jgi:phenylacetate-CoA ligase